ncbi:NAD(P)H-dependent oxidoreductase [Candidatus Micrarchaeota archaeon]|nr:NAD(P)H-dependent oxidoreductase [Candidatus Micrarchaeota archaeon]
MKILIICGSRRKSSLTRKLTDIAFEYAKGKYEDVSYLDLGKNDIEPFRGFEEDYSKETADVIKLMESTDVFIVGSPVYDALLSSGVKNLFEHVNYKALEKSVAGFIIKSNNPGSNQQVRGHLVALANYFNILSNPRPVFSIDGDFDDNGNLKNEKIRERITNLVDSTVELKRKLQ